MRRLQVLFYAFMAGGSIVSAAPRSVTLAWDAAQDASVVGYEICDSFVSGVYDKVNCVNVGNVTTFTINSLQDNSTYYFVAKSLDGNGVESVPSNEVTLQPVPPVDPRCIFPTGDQSILVTPLALMLTGSGSGGSRTKFEFQLSTLGSPVTRIRLLSGTTVLQDISGPDWTNVSGLWFLIPTIAGTYPLTIEATNQYGCVANKLSAFSVTSK